MQFQANATPLKPLARRATNSLPLAPLSLICAPRSRAMPSKPSPPRKGATRMCDHVSQIRAMPTYAVTLLAIYCRGREQDRAVKELARRRAWLTGEQKRQAGLLA